MDDTLSKLLAAEDKAQVAIDSALQQRDQIIEAAHAEARQAEQQFADRAPEIHKSFTDKAEERAGHTIAEMERRFAERQDQLQQMASDNQLAATQAVLGIVLNEEVDEG